MCLRTSWGVDRHSWASFRIGCDAEEAERGCVARFRVPRAAPDTADGRRFLESSGTDLTAEVLGDFLDPFQIGEQVFGQLARGDLIDLRGDCIREFL